MIKIAAIYWTMLITVFDRLCDYTPDFLRAVLFIRYGRKCKA